MARYVGNQAQNLLQQEGRTSYAVCHCGARLNRFQISNSRDLCRFKCSVENWQEKDLLRGRAALSLKQGLYPLKTGERSTSSTYNLGPPARCGK
jgi:hypothetical protein